MQALRRTINYLLALADAAIYVTKAYFTLDGSQSVRTDESSAWCVIKSATRQKLKNMNSSEPKKSENNEFRTKLKISR